MGSSRAAWRAGQTPNTTPTARLKTTAATMVVVLKWKPQPASWPIPAETTRPMRMPMRPPRSDRVSASTRNWARMSRPRAPIALRMPISRVRSRTETSMMFMIPMPPTTSEIEAIPPSRSVSVALIEEAAASSWVWLKTLKSAVAVGARA